MTAALRAVVLLLLLQSCTSLQDFKKSGDAADSVYLPVPFTEQEVGQCGPAALTMALNWAGRPVKAEQIAPQIYTNGRGTLQNDLVSEARRQGMIAVPIQGTEALLAELQAGHPVIIFENLGISWFPNWHYAVVTGYDFNKKSVFLHSGPHADLETDFSVFASAWRYSDYWGAVILPPGQLSASADQLTHLQAAVGLEEAGQSAAAEKAYLTILERWPRSLEAHIGLGNVYFSRKDFKNSVLYLRKATQLDPGSQAALHNLAVAEAALN